MAPARAVLLLVLFALGACDPGGERAATDSLEGAPVEPPFRVAADAEGLTFTYLGPEGAAVTVGSVAEVPEAARAQVRVRSLTQPPDALEGEVYVADLRQARGDGVYPVRAVSRAAFEALFEAESASAKAAEAPAGEVVLYGASWCGACRQARAYFRERGVPFTDRDIEREPGAREEMQRKASAAGVSSQSIPVIDFRGTILSGFARGRLDALLTAR